MNRRELLIGCGGRRTKDVSLPGFEKWEGLTTLDMNPHHKPDVVYDLRVVPYPFEDDAFDEIHAYEVMEHIAQQGDWKTFFAQWSEFWRILKPEGLFIGTSPKWQLEWAWGDPGHTRTVQKEQFIFLDQTEYTRQIGVTTMTDYRFCYRADFQFVHEGPAAGTSWAFGLRAIKPSRISI